LEPENPLAELQMKYNGLLSDYARQGERIKKLDIDFYNAKRKIAELDNMVQLHFSFSDSPVPDIPLLADHHRRLDCGSEPEAVRLRKDDGTLPVYAQCV
jgi:hypothetical protein